MGSWVHGIDKLLILLFSVDRVYRFRVARGGRVVDGVYRFRVARGGRVVDGGGWRGGRVGGLYLGGLGVGGWGLRS